ncbi:MAG TPA: dienelactone hydrolase family protein [Acidimicrobiia bacterium]|nr:dienelactone hydrolase family protein [Acidimicrobiia bacterium]
MCFDHDSAPPIPEGDRNVVSADLTLEAEDGNTLMAFEAAGEEPSDTGVVVLPDVRGLFRFYKDLTTRLAQAGHDAVAIDYFGRTAEPGERTDDWDFWPHVEKTTLQGISADVAAAVGHLRSGNTARRIFTLGFCFGGSNSWHQAANGHGLSGAIGFYGRPRRDNDAAIDRVGEMTCPILALMGGDDPGIPREVVEEFEEALNRAGVPNEVVIYPGAPHSFFDRKQAEFADASADAWNRVLRFIDANR